MKKCSSVLIILSMFLLSNCAKYIDLVNLHQKQTSIDQIYDFVLIEPEDGKKPFYIQTTEVTAQQWQLIVGKRPKSFFRNCGPSCPVTNVLARDIFIFIEQLNKTDGRYKYRLPTEKEWKLACMTPKSGLYTFGDHLELLNNHAWYSMNSNSDIQPVALKEPNAYGLYDIHGNAWELTSTCKNKDIEKLNSVDECYTYVIKGGGASSKETDLEISNTAKQDRPVAGIYVGFRLIREI